MLNAIRVHVLVKPAHIIHVPSTNVFTVPQTIFSITNFTSPLASSANILVIQANNILTVKSLESRNLCT
jgi:hypothetical protein